MIINSFTLIRKSIIAQSATKIIFNCYCISSWNSFYFFKLSIQFKNTSYIKVTPIKLYELVREISSFFI